MTFDLFNYLLLKKYVNAIKIIMYLSHRIKKGFSLKLVQKESLKLCIMIFIILLLFSYFLLKLIRTTILINNAWPFPEIV